MTSLEAGWGIICVNKGPESIYEIYYNQNIVTFQNMHPSFVDEP